MYAVIKTGGKQYRVAPGDTIHVDRLTGDVGSLIELDDVLAVSGADKMVVGQPKVEGASVVGEILAHDRGKKILIFKSKKRKTYRKRQGHRQDLTELRIKEIKES